MYEELVSYKLRGAFVAPEMEGKVEKMWSDIRVTGNDVTLPFKLAK